MALLCRLLGHQAQSRHSHNCALDFALCHHCGCYLIRTKGGDWGEVPRGFRVVWRRKSERSAAEVAAFMAQSARAVAKRVRPAAPLNRPLKRPNAISSLVSGAITLRAMLRLGHIAPDVSEGWLRPTELPPRIMYLRYLP